MKEFEKYLVVRMDRMGVVEIVFASDEPAIADAVAATMARDNPNKRYMVYQEV